MISPALLQQPASAAILVVGDIMLDRYISGDAQRLSPEAPVPVININQVEERLGGAANVARNIAHLDAKVGLLGIIGEDPDGRTVGQLLAGEQIQAQLCRQALRPTISKTRIISRQQQIVRLDQEYPFSMQDAMALNQQFAALYRHYDIIVFSDYHKGSLCGIGEMISLAKAAGKTVLIDPKQRELSLYAGADLITPNLNEFIACGGDMRSEQTMLQSARYLIAQAGINAMLLTRSEQGMSLITASSHHYFPADKVAVSDVTGAGDTVIATLAVMLSGGCPLAQAAEIANLAAAIAVSQPGVVAVSRQELVAKLRQRGIEPVADSTNACQSALQQIAEAKSRGERIVFTNGCFDILHAGHVRYLTQAKALGDRLVVGVNCDASVRRLKGQQRPINALADRLSVLSGLAAVDWVIPFGEQPDEQDTPLELIKKICPDVLVKGGDYTVETIIGADVVRARGGEVKTLSYLQHRSTSHIIDKIGGCYASKH